MHDWPWLLIAWNGGQLKLTLNHDGSKHCGHALIYTQLTGKAHVSSNTVATASSLPRIRTPTTADIWFAGLLAPPQNG